MMIEVNCMVNSLKEVGVMNGEDVWIEGLCSELIEMPVVVRMK